MIQIPGRIPIFIHPLFWLFAGLIGWLNSMSFLGTLIWIGIIFVSVLVHEFGHALTSIAFGLNPKIELVAIGGVTSYQTGKKLSFWKQFLIVFNGPLFGIFLFLSATALLQLDWSAHPIWHNAILTFQVVNLFWSIINLLPILPLDGGQLLRIVMEAIFGFKGLRYSLFIGMFIGVLLSFFFFLTQSFLIGAIFFLFAFQSFDSWRRTKKLTATDRVEENRDELIEAEKALQRGDKNEAKRLLEDVRNKAKQGLLYTAATQYLAFISFEEGDKKKAYELFSSVEESLEEQAISLFHKLCYEEKDYARVARLSSQCYQLNSTKEVALYNAAAFSQLHEVKPAVGWLQTAWQFGDLDVKATLEEEIFSPIKESQEVKAFLEKIAK